MYADAGKFLHGMAYYLTKIVNYLDIKMADGMTFCRKFVLARTLTLLMPSRHDHKAARDRFFKY